MSEDRAKKILNKSKSISGISNKKNLEAWADYSKGNSWHPGDSRGVKSGPVAGGGDFEEGRGWAPMDTVTKRNTFTGEKA
jgi:hypothetical protein